MNSATQSSAFNEKFVGDRYERLHQGAEVVARDPSVGDAPYPFNDAGLRSLVTAIAVHRLFDHLSDPTADMVTALVLLDFPGGAHQVAARIHHLLATSGVRPGYDVLALVSGLAAVLALMVDTDAWLFANTGDGG